MGSEKTRVQNTAQSLLRLLEEGRRKIALSRHHYFTQALRVWDATLRGADLDEFLNVACVGVEKAYKELSQAFCELANQASRNYHDVLGWIYMLGELGGPGQEFTPLDLARLLVRLSMGDVSPPPPDGPPLTFYDPACGSGTLLLAAASYLDEIHPELLKAGRLQFYGQEISYDAWLMTRVNLRLHGMTTSMWQRAELSVHEQQIVGHLLPPGAPVLVLRSAPRPFGESEEPSPEPPASVTQTATGSVEPSESPPDETH